MTTDTLSLSSAFPDTDEAQWIQAVTKALKGAGPEKLARKTADGLMIKPLYREADWPSASNLLGHPGEAPFLRGADAERNAYLPWDIRQAFAHPAPKITNAEILRDLERGVSSVELLIDPHGLHGCAISNAQKLDQALNGIDAHIAEIAIDAPGYHLESAALLGQWGAAQAKQETLKLAFNFSPLSTLARLGTLEESLDSAFARTAALAISLAKTFPMARLFRIDARPVHEAGGTPAQELAVLIAEAIDTLRRLDAAGLALDTASTKLVFSLSVGPDYGQDIAKLRAARQLWGRCLEALDLPPSPMRLQAVSSRRMLTKRDPWVNLLRNTAACFAAGAGGADIITLRPFTDAIGLADELGRRTARNTQIIAQEESQIGRVADPAGGAWFMEDHARALAETAWAEFQKIESEGGYAASLVADQIQTRIGDARKHLIKAVAQRKIPITGVSEFPQLEEIDAPTADLSDWNAGADTVTAVFPETVPQASGETLASPLWPIRLSEGFERLRDHADIATERTGVQPSIFLATLGPLAEHTARADFARNLFAVGGIKTRRAPVPPKNKEELVAAWRASGCALAVICGSDDRYADEAAQAAKALKAAGVQRLYLAGKPTGNEAEWRDAGMDSFIHIGIDVAATLELAHAELGIGT